MKTTKVSPTIVTVAIFVIVLAIILGGTSLATARESRPGSLPPDANMQEWLTYTDERFNFSVQYPPDWHITVLPADLAGGGVQISNYPPSALQPKKPAPEDYFGINIVVVGGNPIKPGQSLIEWRHARGDYGFVEPKIKEEKLVSVNALEGLEETVEYVPGSAITTIYFKYSDERYGETVLFFSGGPVDQQVMEDTFRQILSTFRMKK